jgi:hypothetical protein
MLTLNSLCLVKLKVPKNTLDKHLLLRNEVYQSHLFEEIIEEIKRIVEDKIENKIKRFHTTTWIIV